MYITFALLIALFAANAAAPIINGVFVQHVVYFAAGLTLAGAATALPPADITAATSRLRPFVPAMVFPIVWMVMQIVPIPLVSVVNSIWSATALALNEPTLRSRISIDAGSTLGSLAWYLTVLSVLVSTVLLTKDRRRAETALVTLTTVATLIALENLLSRIDTLAAVFAAAGAFREHVFLMAGPIAALGNAAIVAMAAERYATRADSGVPSTTELLRRPIPGIIGAALAWMSIAVSANGNLLALTGLGYVVMAFVAIMRRLRFSPRSSAILAGILVTLAGVSILLLGRSTPPSELLGIVQTTEPPSLAIAQRALADSSWLGSGVGTYSQIARVYLEYGARSVPVAPSTATLVAIEWGRAALPILVIISLEIFFHGVSSAVDRGRDSFYSSATAAIVVVALGEAFLDSSMLAPPIQLLLAGMVGLGISQSVGKSRT